MPGEVANTYSMMVRGTGGTAAGTDTLIGAITLPANGPWIIHMLWAYAVINAAGAAEASNGVIYVQSASGDMIPNPQPSYFPIASVPSYLGAPTGKPLVPLSKFPVHWEAAGKATINLRYINDAAKTAGDVICMGLIFGKAVPEQSRYRFCDRVTAAVTALGSSAVGTITLAESASKITGLGAQVVQDNVSTATQEILPYWSMTSADVDFNPAEWPCTFASCIGLATNHGLNNAIEPLLIPVDIPVIGGARIACTVNLLAAVTNAAQATVYIAYE